MKFKKVLLISTFFFIAILINLPYKMHFSNILSDSSQDWAKYATYFSNIISPLLTLIGIIILIQEYFENSRLKHQEERI